MSKLPDMELRLTQGNVTLIAGACDEFASHPDDHIAILWLEEYEGEGPALGMSATQLRELIAFLTGVLDAFYLNRESAA